MTCGGVQMFTDKLNQILNSNDMPLFNHPEIRIKRPQLQLLYGELRSMIQTFFMGEHHELGKLNALKQRFIHAAAEAEHLVDLFLSDVIIRNYPSLNDDQHFHNLLQRCSYAMECNAVLLTSGVHVRNNRHLKRSLNLVDVRRSLKSIKVEFMSICIDGMKMDSSPRPQTTLNQSVAGPSSTSRNSPGSKKLFDEISLFVGIDGDAELIRDKLVEDQKKLDVVSIVGMGGIGKTTLAAKIFNDGFVKYLFHVRVWVTVSQTYDKRSVLIQILESIDVKPDIETDSDSRLRELVHKNLMGKRYLIVIDDIWDMQTWDDLKVFFPHDNNGSRILLTSRLIEVAKHAKSDGLIHHLGCLNKEKGWELLCQKVFHGSQCPGWSIKPGMQIVENCQGLPLALVVIAGVLEKEAWSEKFWEEIAESTGSYIVGGQNGCLEILALSYNHLPLHLRECFLCLGGFPEDHMFNVKRLIWLWVAEGFIQKDGNSSLEDIAEGYLMDLIDRNLVVVADRSKSNGGVKACKLHDLIRELCLRKAKEEGFILIMESSPQFSDVLTQPYKPVRIVLTKDIPFRGIPYSPAENVRSVFCSTDSITCILINSNYFRSFKLLRVLDLQYCRPTSFPKMKLLVHLRYLAIWKEPNSFPSSEENLKLICNLRSLQTLIYFTHHSGIGLPSNISGMVNLRHLWGNHPFYLRSIKKPMSLQTISKVRLKDVDNFSKHFPYIKQLTCFTNTHKHHDFKSLTYLEKLNLSTNETERVECRFTFPATLKTLALQYCRLPWSEMSVIQSLSNLQVLKLKYAAFEGSCWNTDEQEFPQLKFLRIDGLDIKRWEAYSRSFPCLRQLEIKWCAYLEEISLEIGDIPTLELIQVKECSPSVDESVRRIEEEQRELGNYDLKIDIQPRRAR